jgi:pyruvate/2-oxoglutarate dehydrogenase complex dihydrolipoamide dehydrogenase (E3) component
MKAAIAERARFGRTCVNTGCIPTKAMVASAYAARVARQAAAYGVVIHGAVAVDLQRSRPAKPPSPPNREKASNAGLRAWLAAPSIKVTRASNHPR